MCLIKAFSAHCLSDINKIREEETIRTKRSKKDLVECVGLRLMLQYSWKDFPIVWVISSIQLMRAWRQIWLFVNISPKEIY